MLRGTAANPREVVLCCMAYACNVIDNVLNKLEDHRQEIAEEKLQRFLNSWPQAAADRESSLPFLLSARVFLRMLRTRGPAERRGDQERCASRLHARTP